MKSWSEIKGDLSSSLLIALDRVWYRGGTLMSQEKKALRTVHQKHPFGQPNFNAWVRQTLRQIFENAVRKAGR